MRIKYYRTIQKFRNHQESFCRGSCEKFNKDRKDIQKKIDVKKVEIDTLKKQGIPDFTILEEKKNAVLDKLNGLLEKKSC